MFRLKGVVFADRVCAVFDIQILSPKIYILIEP